MQRRASFNLRSRPYLTYPLGVLITLVLTVILLGFNGRLQISTVTLLYLLPVGISSALLGLGPAILTVLAAFFSLNYFFIPPYGTLNVHKPQDLVTLIVFLVLAVSISQLVARMTQGLNLARTRENETARLYELSLTLSRLYREADILKGLAAHTLETFRADRVEVFTESESGTSLVGLPENNSSASKPPQPPTALVSLQGSQRLLGEIRLWRSDWLLDSAEMLLLQTFARQGALALERAYLASSESRARLLEESDRMKSALLSSVSHELRTPLVTITGALSTLADDQIVLDEPSRHSLIETATEEADRLNLLVGNLLDMTRLEAGALRIKREPCDVQDLIGSALEELATRLKDRSVIVDLPKALPLVPLDFVLVERVLVNLIDNALKYSPDGSPLDISANASANIIQIRVSDRGPGIPAAELGNVFDKFYRIRGPDSISGTGLGLSISKGIIRAHGGFIAAENRPGGGTSIVISLPLE